MSAGRPYHKINTLYKRDERGKILFGEFVRPVYESIMLWRASEKIDGTNIRLHFEGIRVGDELKPGTMTIGGRTDNAQIPATIIEHIRELDLEAVWETMLAHDVETFTLFGEGFGPRIQKGGGDYGDEVRFILYDIRVGGNIYLIDDAVTENAQKWGMLRAPDLGTHTLDHWISMVKEGFPSFVEGASPNKVAEGVVCRTVEPLYDQRGERLILKIKTKDFQ